MPDRRSLHRRWLPGHRWVAEVDGAVAGWAAAGAVSDRAGYAGVAETSVFVGEGHRGRGVGRALLHRQVTAADAAGLWTLQASVFPENRAGIALHRSAGYRTPGLRERIGRHHGRWRDTVLLERRRTDAPDPPHRCPPQGPPSDRGPGCAFLVPPRPLVCGGRRGPRHTRTLAVLPFAVAEEGERSTTAL